MKLCIIGVPARCATQQSGFKLLVSNGIKEALMTTALTDRIVARYMREAQQRQAEHPALPVRRDGVHAESLDSLTRRPLHHRAAFTARPARMAARTRAWLVSA
jgi:16S rRNA C1402 N4-methylase RsmH